MLDTAIRGGFIIDGTGAQRQRFDIGIKGGRIAALGKDVPEARREIDATGQVVAPGFIDLHTHYDAQAFWDPLLTPSILHGVTTIFGGNCGFSIAPLSPASAQYVRPMLSRVEGMPIESLEAGVPWDWNSTADFLERLEGRLALNSGWFVGHSALRALVMGSEAQGPATATAKQIAQMEELLRQGLQAGAMGFSSTWSTSHTDHHGEPVPSRFSELDELVRLSKVVGEFPGTTLEFIPSVVRFQPKHIEALTAMSAAANRPINWNSLLVEGYDDEFLEHQLAAADHAASHGGRIVALTPVDSRHHLVNLRSGILFDALPGWDAFMALPYDDRIALLKDRDRRTELGRMAAGAEGYLGRLAEWSNLLLVQTFTPAYEKFVGMSMGQIADALGCTTFDAFSEIAIADELFTVVTLKDEGQDMDTWRRRLRIWRDPRTLIGGSDAGAHLDMADGFTYPTVLLGKAVRDLQLLPLEEAVMMLTSKPARFYGLRDRGSIVRDAWADLVVFDPATIGANPVATRFDLPAGAPRLYATANGIQHVFVNGKEVLHNGEATGATPGSVLRSGQDSQTVEARPY
jgi:N-acyl-D-aspartate/D-glutamate deacylase